ncbi:hypothetical protein GcC1_161008 [Golovinomyces cichoracearum]|uniref:Complex 1 LYR protein domain-containing protein n=1 Tax=Golovinomyces cichoracearum TaxID=62708 RepID=A0A420HTT9_9PEZI|nr:hypothetical protein GcC1_161008 [Golovinomyces cichoracearum]
MSNQNLRKQVIIIYKGREYPLGYSYFRRRLHDAFKKNSSLTDENAIRDGIKRAEYFDWRKVFLEKVSCAEEEI